MSDLATGLISAPSIEVALSACRTCEIANYSYQYKIIVFILGNDGSFADFDYNSRSYFWLSPDRWCGGL